MRLYRFYLDLEKESHELNEDAAHITISDEDLIHQLINVLRMNEESKEVVCFFDSSSKIYETQIKEFTYTKKNKAPNKVIFTINKTTSSEKELKKKITFFIPIIKIDKFEWMLQKLTELGVQSMVPVNFERSQKPNLEKISTEKAYERFKKIVIEATEQCEGAILPEILKPISFNELEKHIDNGAQNIYASERLADEASSSEDKLSLSSSKEINLLVGPEGGLSEDEVASLDKLGFNAQSLGIRILKAETAALILLSKNIA